MFKIFKNIFLLLTTVLTLVLTISILFSLTPIKKRGINAVSETRYMRSNTQSINSLTAYQLGTTQSSSSLSTTVSSPLGNGYQNLTVFWGIRVWKRNSSGTETEITSGTPVAQVSRSSIASGLQSATWTPSTTSLNTTDSIVVRVYIQVGTNGWQQGATSPIFTTEQLGNSILDNQTWTIYYYTQYTGFSGTPASNRYTAGTFHWGSATYNSRIENFSHFSPTLTVGTTGTQISTVDTGSHNVHIGGAFTLVSSSGSINVNSIKISEIGSVAANTYLTNVKLYYETAGTCTYNGTESQYGSTTSFNSSQQATFTQTLSVTTSQVCIYVVFDVHESAPDTSTIDIQITNPSTDVTVDTGANSSPATAVNISGNTTINFVVAVSISLTTDGSVSWGIMESNTSNSTISLPDTEVIHSDSNVNIDLNVKSSNATGGSVNWTLGSTSGTDTFVYEYSSNSGSNWNTFLIPDSYYSFVSGLTPDSTQNLDLRITTPTVSSEFDQKTITVTIQAVQSS